MISSITEGGVSREEKKMFKFVDVLTDEVATIQRKLKKLENAMEVYGKKCWKINVGKK